MTLEKVPTLTQVKNWVQNNATANDASNLGGNSPSHYENPTASLHTPRDVGGPTNAQLFSESSSASVAQSGTRSATSTHSYVIDAGFVETVNFSGQIDVSQGTGAVTKSATWTIDFIANDRDGNQVFNDTYTGDETWGSESSFTRSESTTYTVPDDVLVGHVEVFLEFDIYDHNQYETTNITFIRDSDADEHSMTPHHHPI